MHLHTAAAALLLLLASSALCAADVTDDVTSQEEGGAKQPRKMNMEPGKIDRDEFKKNFRDLLGPTWTNFDLPNVNYYLLPLLNYSYSSLEPYFTTDQVTYHYEGNLEIHRRELDSVVRDWRKKYPEDSLAFRSLVDILRQVNSVPSAFLDRYLRHGSAYVNHALYFGLLSPNHEDKERYPMGRFKMQLEETFQTYEQFKGRFTRIANNMKGVGSVALVERGDGKLKIEIYPDNHTPLVSGGYPLLVLDLWEHAFYLKHHHHRERYIDDWWMLVDWTQVEKLQQFWHGLDAKWKRQAEEEAAAAVGAGEQEGQSQTGDESNKDEL